MSRTKLAFDARDIGRSIFASLPFETRASAVFLGVLKTAYQAGDEETMGLIALTAMVEAGIEGDLFGIPMDNVAEMIRKRDRKANSLAKSLGTEILKLGLKKYRNADDIHEQAIQKVMDQLLTSNDLKRGMKVPQAIKFLATKIWMAASTVARSSEFQRADRNRAPESLERIVGNPSVWKDYMTSRDAQKILNSIKRDRALLDNDGEPRMYTYLLGQIEGLTDAAIAQELGMTPSALIKWVREPARWNKVKKHFQDYLS